MENKTENRLLKILNKMWGKGNIPEQWETSLRINTHK
jgi:hypothetical protein